MADEKNESSGDRVAGRDRFPDLILERLPGRKSAKLCNLKLEVLYCRGVRKPPRAGVARCGVGGGYGSAALAVPGGARRDRGPGANGAPTAATQPSHGRVERTPGPRTVVAPGPGPANAESCPRSCRTATLPLGHELKPSDCRPARGRLPSVVREKPAAMETGLAAVRGTGRSGRYEDAPVRRRAVGRSATITRPRRPRGPVRPPHRASRPAPDRAHRAP